MNVYRYTGNGYSDPLTSVRRMVLRDLSMSDEAGKSNACRQQI